MSGKVATAKSHIEAINKSGEPKDNFVNRMTETITGLETITNNIAKDSAKLVLTHKTSTAFFGLKETEETAKDSKEFLKIFSEFFRNAADCLVKVEKKRGGGRVKETRAKTGKPGANEEQKAEKVELKKRASNTDGQQPMLPMSSEPPKLRAPLPRASRVGGPEDFGGPQMMPTEGTTLKAPRARP